MIIALIVYVVVYLIGTFILTIPHDTKFTTYKSRVQFSGLCMIVWPMFIPLGLLYAIKELKETINDRKKQKKYPPIIREEFDTVVRMYAGGPQPLSREEIERILKLPTITHPKTTHWNTDSDSQEF